VLTNKKEHHTAALFVNQIKEVVTHPDVGFVTSENQNEEETKEDEKDTEEDEKPEKKVSGGGDKKSKKKKTGRDKSESEKEKDNDKGEETHFEGSFTLIGHSMGGAVSIAFAHAHPDFVRSRLLPFRNRSSAKNEGACIGVDWVSRVALPCACLSGSDESALAGI